ncbi:MAG: hypothetical protein FWG68_04230 [Defluviitaleaceae bacterium]|nr:hypothetical protein [Defluviitaleaceae bacterium]
MSCPKCGAKQLSAGKFCQSCGVALPKSTTPTYKNRYLQTKNVNYNVVKAVIITAVIVFAVSLGFYTRALNNNRISELQNTPIQPFLSLLQIPFLSTTATYGELLENFCTDTTWTASDGFSAEFTGTTLQGERVIINFSKMTLTGWEVRRMYANLRELDDWEIVNWFAEALHYTGL